MVKIYHFVNLVVWEELKAILQDENTDTIKHVMYCDSWSMFLAMRMFGYLGKRIAGTEYLFNLLAHLDHNFLILSSGKEELNTSAKIQVLPKDVTPENFTLGKLGNEISSVIVGISSPKQNALAIKIAMENPHIKNIYCFGAAVDLILPRPTIKQPNLLTFYI